MKAAPREGPLPPPLQQPQPKIPQWAVAFLQKAIDYLHQEETRKQIQEMIIDPLLTNVMTRVFPYIILTCVLFILLLIVILVTLGIIVVHMRTSAVTFANPLPLPI